MYIVRPSDTLTGIAKRQLGSVRRWRDIARLNADTLPDPNRLKPGMRLRLPSQGGPSAPAQKPSAPDRTKRYTVTETDTLPGLAMRFYGTLRGMAILREANEDVLQSDQPLQSGVVLAIPNVNPAGRRTHTVRAGDTLSALADRYYGDASAWRRLVDANPTVINDPADLRIGTTLVIPPE